MNFKEHIKSNLTKDQNISLIVEYFTTYGFELRSQNESRLIFGSGSILRNMLTFNPLNWKSETIIQLSDSEVILNSEINTMFQTVTKQEEAVWNTFIKSFRKTIENGKMELDANQESIEVNKSSSYGYLGYAVLGGFIFGIPSGFIAHFTGLDFIVSIGAACGAMCFVLWKRNREY